MVKALYKLWSHQKPLRHQMIRTTLKFVRPYANYKARPGPPRLEKSAQEEFERLQKQAMEQPADLHPETRQTYPEFTGDTNPLTGEVGGPKQDPLRHGDYSFNGRVTDF